MDGNAERVRRMLLAFSEGDPGESRSLVAPDYVDHQGGGEGREGFVETLRAAHRLYPGIKATVEALLEQGETVAVHVRWDGTAASGSPVHATSIDIVEFRDGLAVAHWGVSEGWT